LSRYEKNLHNPGITYTIYENPVFVDFIEKSDWILYLRSIVFEEGKSCGLFSFSKYIPDLDKEN
jgi:hypothetical protein